MNVHLIPAYNPGPLTAEGNNTYLLTGAAPLLIDAGTGDPRHLDAVARTLGRGILTRVLVSHAHSDHVAGVGELARRWPMAAFAKWPWPERDARYSVDWVPLRDGDLIAAGDTVLRAVHTPGHSPDHLSFYDEDTRTLFSGDLVISGTTVVIPASHGGSLIQYLDSLRRVLDLAPARLLPAHGQAIENPPAVIEPYLAHRRDREAQVVAALRSGDRSVDAVVSRIYGGLADSLRLPAGETVLAHLQKLEAEGKAVREGRGTWMLTEAGRGA